jgi:hypothetical protein
VAPPSIAISDFYITLVEIFILVLFSRWVMDLLFKSKTYISIFDKCFIPLLFYFVFSLLLGSAKYGVSQALADFRQFLPLALYFWAMRFFGQAKDLAEVRRSLFNVMLWVAIYILVAFLFFRGIMAAADGRMANRVFFDNTLFILMAYGGYLLGRAIHAQKGRIYLFCLLGLNTLMLLIMQVRTYWIAFAVALGAEAIRSRLAFFSTRIFLFSAYLFILILCSGALFMEIAPGTSQSFEGISTSIGGRISSLFNLKQTLFDWKAVEGSEVETISTRAVTAQTVWNDYVIKQPLFGTGFGGELPIMSPLGGVVLMKYQIDNGYLTILAKFGLIGFIIYGLILWKICRTLYVIVRSPFAKADEKLLARSFLAGFAAMMIASFFSSVFIRQQPNLVGFLLILAEIAVMQRNIEYRIHQG